MLLVTGGTGNVGGAVLAELAGKPVPVRALVRDPARLPAGLCGAAAPNIQVVQGDFADAASLRRALEGVEAAFLASALGPRMVELQLRFVEAAKAAGVARLVQLSAAGANRNMCCTRVLRWLGELECGVAAAGLATTHLRPTVFMQNLFEFADDIRSKGLIAGPFRTVKWTWVDARDVGAVAAATLVDASHAGRSYTITGSDSLSYSEVAERMSEVFGRPVRYLDITANEARGRLQAAGASPVMIEAKLELWDACVSKVLNIPPNDVVRELTGREPRSLEAFLRDYRARFV